MKNRIRKSASNLAGPWLPLAPIMNLEFVSWIGGEEVRYMTKPLGQPWRGQQRILALAKIVIIEVHCQREHVNGQRVGKRRFEKTVSGALVDGFSAARILGPPARLPSILARFATHLSLRLRPHQRRKALRYARYAYTVMGHVNEALEGQAEAILQQPS